MLDVWLTLLIMIQLFRTAKDFFRCATTSRLHFSVRALYKIYVITLNSNAVQLRDDGAAQKSESVSPFKQIIT